MNSIKRVSTVLALLFLLLTACASILPAPLGKAAATSLPEVQALTKTSPEKNQSPSAQANLSNAPKTNVPEQTVPTLPPIPKDLLDSLSPTLPPTTAAVLPTLPVKPEAKITLALAKNSPNPTEEPATQEAAPGEGAPSEAAATEESAPADTSFNAWCLPMDYVNPDPQNPPPAWKMPEGASKLTYTKKNYELTVPATACYFTYTAAQAVSGKVKLLVSDYSGANTRSAPWLVKEMAPTDDDPSLFWVEIKHDYIRNPPFWFVAYKFTVQTADEQNLWANDIYINRGWRPKLCDTGLFPDPTTLKCKKWQDMHPWDPWYTPVPPEPTEVPAATKRPE